MIGILVFPDFQLLDAAGPISVFEIAARFAEGAPAIRVLAVTPGSVRSSSGVEILARGLKPSGGITTLIVAGGEGVRQAATCEKTLGFVRAIAKRGVRIASVCPGAYILAEAGLLDGRRATTHWQRTPHFLKTYPQVKLEPDRIYVRDGDIWTSAGISAGIDLSLAMISEDYGDEIAQKSAKQLVLYHRRSGGQSQFSSLLELKAPNGRFGPLLAWALTTRPTQGTVISGLFRLIYLPTRRRGPSRRASISSLRLPESQSNSRYTRSLTILASPRPCFHLSGVSPGMVGSAAPFQRLDH